MGVEGAAQSAENFGDERLDRSEGNCVASNAISAGTSRNDRWNRGVLPATARARPKRGAPCIGRALRAGIERSEAPFLVRLERDRDRTDRHRIRKRKSSMEKWPATAGF